MILTVEEQDAAISILQRANFLAGWEKIGGPVPGSPNLRRGNLALSFFWREGAPVLYVTVFIQKTIPGWFGRTSIKEIPLNVPLTEDNAVVWEFVRGLLAVLNEELASIILSSLEGAGSNGSGELSLVDKAALANETL